MKRGFLLRGNVTVDTRTNEIKAAAESTASEGAASFEVHQQVVEGVKMTRIRPSTDDGLMDIKVIGGKLVLTPSAEKLS